MSIASSSPVSPPRRFIFNDADMVKFLESPAKKELLQVTQAMGKSCATQNDFVYDPEAPLTGLSPPLAALHGALCGMLLWLPDFPPVDQSKARFGNPAFRKWHQRLLDRSAAIVFCVLQIHRQYPERTDYDISVLETASLAGYKASNVSKQAKSVHDTEDRKVVVELCAYLTAAFGHPIRLDYGTGHECSFQVFLYTLLKLGCFGSTQTEPPTSERLKAITIAIYSAFLPVTRQLQTDYMLEPAGSHGVWGLDDYHCLPFYFGACQLQADGDEYVPSNIHNDSTLACEGDTFLYFGCIRYIKTLKKGVPFFEHSPMLNDISQLPNWEKVASGLLRLFEGEVLKKRQVVQHFVFGNIFAANWIPSESSEKQAPTTTFREPALGAMAKAPWADGEDNDGPSSGLPPPTRAPWAK